MNLIEQIARMIDVEGAYAETFDQNGNPAPRTARQNYFRAYYECVAVDILKLFQSVSRDRVRQELIEFEKDCWRELGVPIDDPRLKARADRIISGKFS